MTENEHILLTVAKAAIGDHVERVRNESPHNLPFGWYISMGGNAVVYLGKSRDDAIRKIIEIAKGKK